MALCPGCGKDAADTAAFCDRCGARLASICPQCHHEVGVDSRFCPECGLSLYDAPPAQLVPTPVSGSGDRRLERNAAEADLRVLGYIIVVLLGLIEIACVAVIMSQTSRSGRFGLENLLPLIIGFECVVATVLILNLSGIRSRVPLLGSSRPLSVFAGWTIFVVQAMVVTGVVLTTTRPSALPPTAAPSPSPSPQLASIPQTASISAPTTVPSRTVFPTITPEPTITRAPTATPTRTTAPTSGGGQAAVGSLPRPDPITSRATFAGKHDGGTGGAFAFTVAADGRTIESMKAEQLQCAEGQVEALTFPSGSGMRTIGFTSGLVASSLAPVEVVDGAIKIEAGRLDGQNVVEVLGQLLGQQARGTLALQLDSSRLSPGFTLSSCHFRVSWEATRAAAPSAASVASPVAASQAQATPTRTTVPPTATLVPATPTPAATPTRTVPSSDPSLARISGRVFRSDTGAGVAGAVVELHRVDENTKQLTKDTKVKEDTAVQGGGYQLSGVAPGVYVLRVQVNYARGDIPSCSSRSRGSSSPPAIDVGRTKAGDESMIVEPAPGQMLQVITAGPLRVGANQGLGRDVDVAC